jgi:hypothetical protein
MIPLTTAVYSQKVGPQSLSYIYTINSFIHFILATLITVWFSKYSVLKIIKWIVLACAGVLVLDSLLIASPYLKESSTSVVTFLIITAYRVNSILQMITWMLAAQFFSGLHAKKAYPILITVSAAGGLGGNAIMGYFSNTVPLVYFMLFCATCLCVGFVIVSILQSRFWHINYERSEVINIPKTLKFIFTNRSWIILLVIISSVHCFSNVSALEFIYSVNKKYSSYENMASYFGYFGIVSSICVIGFGFVTSRIIVQLGIWNTISLTLLIIMFGFLILVFSNNQIYLDSFSRVINILFSQMALMASSVLCKYAKLKYQNQVIAIFSFLPNSIGTLAAGQVSLLLKMNVLSFSEFSLLMAFIVLGVLLWTKYSEGTYTQILKGGVEDDLFVKLRAENQLSITDSMSTKSVYDSFAEERTQNRSLSENVAYEINAKITDVSIVKVILRTLEGLHNDNPKIRKKALTALNSYLFLGDTITPWLLSPIKDDDIEIAGEALIMLYKFEPELSLAKAVDIIKRLIESNYWSHHVLALKIIQTLSLKEYTDAVKYAMESEEELIREQAYLAYASLSKEDNDQDIMVLKNHLNEQSQRASGALIKALQLIVINKKSIFFELVFSADLFVWRNTTRLLLKWGCESEYESIIHSAINKIHMVYENLELIDFILSYSTGYYANILVEHFKVRIDVILQEVIYIIAYEARDEGIVDSLYTEIRNDNPNVKATALELLDTLGNKDLTKHLVSYFMLKSNADRIEYAKSVWHIESSSSHKAFAMLLMESNRWIKICTLYIIALIRDPYFSKIISLLITKEKDEFVKSCAEKTLLKINEGEDMYKKSSEIDVLDLIVFLKACNPFKEIHLNTIAFIAKLLIQKNYNQGEVIVSEGDEVSDICILYKGKVLVKRRLQEDQYKTLAVLEQPSFFCVHSMIHRIRSYETIVAETDVTVFFFSRKIYKNIMILHPEIAIGLLSEVSAYTCMIEKEI